MAVSSTSFVKGQTGNPAGKRRGSRHKTTLAMDALLEGDAEKLTRRAIDLALEGDTVALRLCLDRLSPVRKDRPIQFELPAIETVQDLVKATASVLEAVAAGDLTPSEAAELSKIIDAHIQAIKATDLAERLARLEEMHA
jgi:hypothetical protein